MTVNGRTQLAALVLTILGLAGAWKPFAVVLGLVVTWWAVRLIRHPWGPCPWCRGRRGRNAGSDDAQWGDCPHCGRTGQRARSGARWVHRNLRR